MRHRGMILNNNISKGTVRYLLQIPRIRKRKCVFKVMQGRRWQGIYRLKLSTGGSCPPMSCSRSRGGSRCRWRHRFRIRSGLFTAQAVDDIKPQHFKKRQRLAIARTTCENTHGGPDEYSHPPRHLSLEADPWSLQHAMLLQLTADYQRPNTRGKKYTYARA